MKTSCTVEVGSQPVEIVCEHWSPEHGASLVTLIALVSPRPPPPRPVLFSKLWATIRLYVSCSLTSRSEALDLEQLLYGFSSRKEGSHSERQGLMEAMKTAVHAS